MRRGRGSCGAGLEAGLGWKREVLEFVGEIAGVGEAGKDVFSRQARVVGEDFVFGLEGCQEFQDEVNGHTSTAVDWFAGEDLRVQDDTLWQAHGYRLPQLEVCMYWRNPGLEGRETAPRVGHEPTTLRCNSSASGD